MTTKTKTPIPAVGQPWPEQGGIYVGSRRIDGAVHHVVITDGGTKHDLKGQNFKAVQGVKFGEICGHRDWHAGDQEDHMLAYVSAREHFESTFYWSRSQHHGWPWAFDFEGGNCDNYDRREEFRVRPFRSFPASSI